MKKIYESPEMLVVNVQVARMIAASEIEGFAPEIDDEEGVGGGDALSRRRHNQWEDEEEEDEYDF